MSASREKKIRQDQTSTGWTTPKTARESAADKSQKRSNIMYTVIAVVFVLVAVLAIIWRSNIIPKTATAVTIDGVDYKVSEVNFYYKSTLRGFMTPQNYQILSMLGVDMNSPLDDQIINDNAAAYVGAEPNQTWREFFLDKTVAHMAAIQDVLNIAEEEGYTYPDSVQTQYESAMDELKRSASANGASVNSYLQGTLGRTMTESVYSEQVLRSLQFSAYMDTYRDSLNYTDDQVMAAYNDDTRSFDKVSYEIVNFSGTPDAKTDEEGNPVEATEEETAAAKEAAKAAADKMLAAYKAGGKLEELASANEKASYSSNDTATYSDGNSISAWLFDNARKAGDATVLENGTAYALLVFHDRFHEEYNTIDVRHVLITPEAGTLTSDDEGYADEQAQLKADAHAKAEELLSQWAAGDATEESFAQLAKDNSADSNAAQGGIYKRVAKGDMVEAFNDWCFADGRKAGDTGVVDTDFGSHIMYFVGTDLPKWKADVTDALTYRDFNEWSAQFGKDAETEIHSFGAKFLA